MSFTVHFGASTPWSATPGVSLQAILSSATAGVSDPAVLPHHPITCQTELTFDGDGRLCCAHAAAPPGECRTQSCLVHSVAILLIELAREL